MTKTIIDDFVVINNNYENFYLIYTKYKLKIFINNIIQYKKFDNLYTKYLTKNIIRNLKNIKINNNIAKEITKKINNYNTKFTPPVTRKRNITKSNNNFIKRMKYSNNYTADNICISISNKTQIPQTLLNDNNLEYDNDANKHNFCTLCKYCMYSCCSCMYYIKKIAKHCCYKCKTFFKKLFK